MAKSRNDILFRFLADTKGLERGSKKAQSSMGTFGKSVKKAGLLAAGAFSAVAVADYATEAIQLAVAADEVDSKFQAVFGSAEDLNDSLRVWGDVAGVTESDAKSLAATFGNLAIAQGITADKTEDLTLDVATLAGDMASFNDIEPAVVFQDLNKALLTTEREGMKKYGIAVSENEVKTRALEIATADGRTEVTKADRAYASYSIVVDQAGEANGDLERTADSLANQQRQVAASLEEAQTELGKELIPLQLQWVKIQRSLVIPALMGVTKGIGGYSDALSDLGSSLDTARDSEASFVDRGRSVLEIADNLSSLFDGSAIAAALLSDDLDDAAESAGEAANQLGKVPDNIQNMIDVAEDSREPLLDMAAAEDAVASAADRLRRAFSGNIFGDFFAELQFAKDQLRQSNAGGVDSDRSGGSGSLTRDTGNFTPRHTGGVVPGRRGSNQLIMAKGGETVSTANGSQGGGGGINITVNGALDPVAVAEQIQDMLELYTRTNGTF